MPSLTRIDGRSAPARRIKAVAERLKREISAGRRWSNAELDLLRRTALAVVLAEESTRRALQGELPVADAVKAAGSARRAERDLRNAVVPKPEPELSLGELLQAAL
jgi:hypothetical protein